MLHDGAETPVLIYGASGYVAGELLRLLAGHPRFRVAAVVSSSRPGEHVASIFPHLAGTTVAGLGVTGEREALEALPTGGSAAAFFATPHGEAAALAGRVLAEAAARDTRVHAVDLSADFRFRDRALYQSLYGNPHGAPERLASFRCAVSEHWTGGMPEHVAHPGCFTTAVVLAAYPFVALDLVAPEIFVVAVTGSSGSGRAPQPGTHHPERAHNLYAYHPLSHRHEAEMRMLLAAARPGAEVAVEFVPHSGPFVRGIHATLRLALAEDASAADLVETVNAYYGDRSFVAATLEPPKLGEVAGTNRCRLGIAVRGRTLVVTSAIDNLVKGAAGGAVQWMNRLFGLDEHMGLDLPGLGWM